MKPNLVPLDFYKGTKKAWYLQTKNGLFSHFLPTFFYRAEGQILGAIRQKPLLPREETERLRASAERAVCRKAENIEKSSGKREKMAEKFAHSKFFSYICRVEKSYSMKTFPLITQKNWDWNHFMTHFLHPKNNKKMKPKPNTPY